MKIAVLGGGHGCYAAAADLSEQGHEVRLWRRNAKALAPLIEKGSITLKDENEAREIPLALASSDIDRVIKDAELILIPSPAIAQLDIADAMAPYLEDGQVVFLAPGTFGSYIMAERVKEKGATAAVIWAETGTLPWLARKHDVDTIAITVRATRLPTGFYPAEQAEVGFNVIKKAFASVEQCGDGLSGALMNAGPIIHPPLILMNAGPLQHFDAWDIHNEGTQASIRAVTNQLDQERVAIREALGYVAPHFPLSDHYDNDQWMYGDAHKKLVDSGDWREKIDLHEHRYMTEDTQLGLAFLASAGRMANVPTPVADGLLAIAGAIVGKDLHQGERTLEVLGLAELNVTQLQERLFHGS